MMRRWNRRASRQRGFTLVELVVVMIIISILAGAAVIQIGNHTEKARRVRALQDITTFETAIDLYTAENGYPPTTQQGLQALISKPSGDPVPRNWSGPYLKKKVPLDAWGNEYVYQSPGQINPDSYDIVSYARDGQPGGANEWDMDVTNE